MVGPFTLVPRLKERRNNAKKFESASESVAERQRGPQICKRIFVGSLHLAVMHMAAKGLTAVRLSRRQTRDRDGRGISLRGRR